MCYFERLLVELNNQQVVHILQNLQVEVDSQKKEIERLTCENAALRQKCADAYAAAAAHVAVANADAYAAADAAANAAANTETIYV